MKKMDTFSFDHLDETEFENFCYDLLGELGLVNIRWRKGTGLSTSPSDRGRDIECEHHREGIGGKIEVEKWFVECKHYKRGVPPEKLSGAVAWAQAERPDKLLIIVSDFLSTGAWDYIKTLQSKNPGFKIDVWEKPNLEDITKSKSKLLRKYRISGEFPYLSLLHPTHIKCLREMPFNTLGYFFDCLDKLDSQKRDEIFGFMYEMILRPRYRKAVTGRETIGSLRINEVNHDLFKKRCYEIARMGGLDEMQLVYFIVSFVLQSTFMFADSTSLDKSIERQKVVIVYHQKLIEEEEGDYEENISHIEYSQKLIDELPNRVKRNYELYTYLCENLIEKLFAEEYLLLERYKPNTEEEDKFYNFVLQWYLTQGEQEQNKPKKAPTARTRKTKKAQKTAE
jgi:hypothetical protein